MCLPLLISPCTIKSRGFFLAGTGSPRSSRKRAVKRLCGGGGGVLCSIVCNSGAQCNAHTLTDLTVVCWLDLAFCNYIVCYSLSVLDLGLFCVIVYLCMCAFVVLASVSSVLCQEIG